MDVIMPTSTLVLPAVAWMLKAFGLTVGITAGLIVTALVLLVLVGVYTSLVEWAGIRSLPRDGNRT